MSKKLQTEANALIISFGKQKRKFTPADETQKENADFLIDMLFCLIFCISEIRVISGKKSFSDFLLRHYDRSWVNNSMSTR
ncbi:MAG: hypothetical protein HC846_13425 [Blastocatellia bacterium]|nr:hypothetical protein [Blastocatellia bacterium]